MAAAGVAAIVWGAASFAEHLAAASTRLGVSAFALAVQIAGAEPEELASVIAERPSPYVSGVSRCSPENRTMSQSSR